MLYGSTSSQYAVAIRLRGRQDYVEELQKLEEYWMEEQIRKLDDRIQKLEEADKEQTQRLEDRIQKLEEADKKDLWKPLSAVAAAISVVIASAALVVSLLSLERNLELQASNSASSALERHLNYAANQHVWLGEEQATQGSNATSEGATSTAIHGLYTANIVYDMTENTDEARAWENTARELLRQHRTQLQESVVQTDLRCGSLDNDFSELARSELGGAWC